MVKKIINIIFLAFIYTSIYSQNYNIQYYTVKDGLLHSFVNDIIQDNRGNIWMATGGGLCMFNGVEFKSYTTKNGLNYPRLLSLAVDNKNNIWIGSLNGLNIFDGDTIYTVKNLKRKIIDIEKSYDNKMWVLTDDGVKKIEFKNKNFFIDKINFDFGKNYEPSIFQENKWNSFLVETKNKELFIGINSKLFLHKNKTTSEIKLPDSLKIYSACELQDRRMIFGANNGLYIYKNNKLIKFNNKNIDNFSILKIIQKNNKLWMIGKNNLTENKELYLLSISLTSKKYYRKISVNNGLINNPTSLFIDHENNIWAGSNAGVSVLKGETFVNYTTKNGIVGNKIWGIYQDSFGKIWVGTIGQGLSIIDKDTIYNFTQKDGLPCMYIGAILQDKTNKNKYFIGTSRKGIFVAEYNPKEKSYKFKELKIPLNKGKIRVDDILQDKNNRIWLATLKGLYYSDDGINFIHKKLFANDSAQTPINKLFISDSGVLYVGTKKDGLYVVTDNIVKKYPLYEKNIGVISICEDYDNEIWIASQYKGFLNISKKEKWINEKDGLSSSLIYIFQSDKNGNIWIGSNLGLDKFNAKKYNKTKQINFQHYSIDDGLNALEMNLNGSFIDTDNNIWFATNNGLLKYDYRYDISNRIPPIVSLLNIKIHSKNIDWTQYTDSLTLWNKLPVNPVLPYYQNHISFEFIGISYKNPRKIRYSWKLEGFDKKWVPSSKNRNVVYSNLPPGKYIFKLKSSNNDGVWNNKPLEFSFTITPPFWETWWFISIAIFIILFAFYVFIRLRFRSLRKRQIELQKLVLERTKEIFKQKEEIKQQRDTVYEQKLKIEEIHFRLSDSIDYAKRIQNSLLPSEDLLNNNFYEHFLIFKPKDKVSGDFYWWTKIQHKIIVAAADCTGHGVPGAFMSMLGISYLREIVENEKITDTAIILDLLRKNIIKSLNQTGDYNEPKDGLDIAIISIDTKTNILQYSGANNPLYIIANDELRIMNKENASFVKLYDNLEFKIQNSKLLYEVKPDRMPISIYVKMKNFSSTKIQLKKGDYIYLFSDGFADQFGSKNKKKLGYKRFKNLIFETHNKPMMSQKADMINYFNQWKGNVEQIDDIVLIGIRV